MTVPAHPHPRLSARLERIEGVLGLEPLPWPPVDEPPPTYHALLGAATWTLDDLHELEGLCGTTMQAHRVFDRMNQWDATLAAGKGIADDITNGRASIASWVNYPTPLELDFLGATTPPGHRLSICCKHEVDRDKATPDEHATAMGWITETVRSWGRPEITTRVTFTGYGGEVASGQRVRRWLDAGIAGLVDYVSIDPYNTFGYQGQTRWTHPVELITPWLPLADEYGFRGRLAIDEYSCPEHPAGVDWKVADLAQIVAIADSERMPWFTYFDVEQGVISDGPDHRIKSSPEHLAAFAQHVTQAKGA